MQMKTIQKLLRHVKSFTQIQFQRKTGKSFIAGMGILVFVGLSAVTILNVNAFGPQKAKHGFRVQVTDNVPLNILSFRLEVDGAIRGILGHEVTLANLKSLLNEGNPKFPAEIILIVDDEERTTVSLLKKALESIEAASNPDRDTTIYLLLGKPKSK